MRLLKNISIRNRLLFNLVVWLVIFLTFGMFAALNLENMAEVIQKIYEHPLKASNAAIEARVDIIKMHRDMKDLILSQDDEEKVNELLKTVNGAEQIVLNNLNIVRDSSSISEGVSLATDAVNIMSEWRNSREDIVSLTLSGNRNEAAKINQTTTAGYVTQLENKLDRIDELERGNADTLMNEAWKIENNQKLFLIIAVSVLGVISALLTLLIIRSIGKPLSQLKDTMFQGSNTGKLSEAELDGDNEIVDMARSYNTLVKTLHEQFWMKDGQNDLGLEISGDMGIQELSNRTINFLSRFLEAGNGVLYLYDEEDKALSLYSSFAFTERNRLSNKYEIGEGIVGQAALEKKPILLKNIRLQDGQITSGTICETPLNIYAFPLVYEDELYGVIELSSFEPFTKIKQEFIKEAGKIIAINLHSSIQNQRIRELLRVSEEANERIQRANHQMEEQQRLLEQQTEELQQTNAELEEQQQLLQQQSEELQQTNSQLEEQQQQMEEQSIMLSQQNEEIEGSRQELMARSRQLEKSNKYKSEFLANMSHELRTPLNSIILLSKLLMKNHGGLGDEKDIEKVEVIHNSGKELLRLINDVLDLSKIESGKMKADKVMFHSGELMNDLKKLFRDTAIEKGIKLIMEDEIKGDIYSDKDKISQILRNLLSNAMKFTEAGAVTLKIEREETALGNIVFSVSDTGIGIGEEQLSFIFNEFQQGDGSISRKYGGTGLGLSISKKLAQLIDGEIIVQSTEGSGSCFSLVLRDEGLYIEEDNVSELVACDIDLPQEDKTMASKYLSSKTSLDYTLNLEGRRILIVDDDPRNIFVLASALEEYGAEVFEAENGRAALEKLGAQRFDLILMDIMMPVMDGYTAIREIRRSYRIKHIPIIAVTAKALREDRDKCIEAGANDYISKPVDYDIFIRLVKAWIDKEN